MPALFVIEVEVPSSASAPGAAYDVGDGSAGGR